MVPSTRGSNALRAERSPSPSCFVASVALVGSLGHWDAEAACLLKLERWRETEAQSGPSYFLFSRRADGACQAVCNAILKASPDNEKALLSHLWRSRLPTVCFTYLPGRSARLAFEEPKRCWPRAMRPELLLTCAKCWRQRRDTIPSPVYLHTSFTADVFVLARSCFL